MSGARTPAVIAGGGLAGMLVALCLEEPCTLVCSGLDGAQTATGLAQGGVAAAIGADDDPALHLHDTLAAGDGLVCTDAAGAILRGSGEAIARLAAIGVRFDRAADGRLALGLEAAHGRRRIVHASGDGTGAEIHRALAAAIRAAPQIRILRGQARRAHMVDGRVAGVWVGGQAGEGPAEAFLPTARLVLATGGVGALFAATTNPAGSTGSGLALGLHAGAQVLDPEFVQFHPTALDSGQFPLGLVSEAVRGEGAVLVNGEGARVMAGVPGADLAPRDVVARAIHAELMAGRRVFLDARGISGAKGTAGAFAARFPTIAGLCAALGIDPARQPIPVRPAAHYHMGGLAVDGDGRTCVPGLWAVGEVAATGLHGANRLASNSLLEAAVLAPRVAAGVLSADAGVPAGMPRPLRPAGRPALELVRRIMGRDMGVIRDEAGLCRAIAELLPLAGGCDGALVGLVMAVAALERRESRGGHWRSDFPLPDRQARHARLTLAEAMAMAQTVAQPFSLTA